MSEQGDVTFFGETTKVMTKHCRPGQTSNDNHSLNIDDTVTGGDSK
jgi:hypothetical protein